MSTQTTWQVKLIEEADKLNLKPQATNVAAEETPKAAEPPAAGTMPGTTEVQTTKPISEEGLQDLEKMVKVDVSVDSQEILKEADRLKQFAQAAGSKLFEIEEGLKKLEEMAAADPEVVVSPKYRADLQKLQTLHDQLGTVGGEELQKRLRFAKLIEEIRNTKAHNFNAVQAMIAKILETGRYRLATTEEFKSFAAAKKCPWGTVFYDRRTYIPAIPAEKVAEWKITPATKMLESAFRKMIVAAKEHDRSEMEAKITPMKERGTGRVANILNGIVGTYYLHSPARKENGVDRKEGHVLLSLRDANKDPRREPFLVVDVVEAIGCLSWLEGTGRRSFPLFWLQRGRVITKPNQRLDDTDFKRAVGMIATVRALIQVNTPVTTIKPTAEPTTPTPTEPTQMQPAPEATTATENSTTPETASNEQQELAPKPGRKTRRKK